MKAARPSGCARVKPEPCPLCCDTGTIWRRVRSGRTHRKVPVTARPTILRSYQYFDGDRPQPVASNMGATLELLMAGWESVDCPRCRRKPHKAKKAKKPTRRSKSEQALDVLMNDRAA